MAPPGPATRLLPPLVLALAGVARGTFTVAAWPRVAVVAFGGSVAINCSRSACPGDNATLGLETPLAATPGPGGLRWQSFRLLNVSQWSPGDVTCAARCGDTEANASAGVLVYQLPQRVLLEPVPPVAVGDSRTVTCRVLEVAPLRNLTVTLRRGAETLRTESFGDTEGSASVAVSHVLTVTRGDHGQEVTCHAELSLRPHGPLFARAAAPVTLSVFALPEPPQLEAPAILEAGATAKASCRIAGAFPPGDVRVTAALDREALNVTVAVAGDTVTATAALSPLTPGPRELSCTAAVATAAQTARRQLHVYRFPAPALELSPAAAAAGSEVTVTCHAGATEPSALRLQLREPAGAVLAEGPPPRLQLRLRARRHDDGRRFRCRASLAVGGTAVTKDADARLAVLYLPEIPAGGCPGNRTWVRGAREALWCRATGNPEPTVVCGRDGVAVATGEPEPVTRARAGTYLCNATNALGTRSRRVTVRVEYEPTLSESGCPARRVWVEGQRRELECRADGDPPPSTRCARDGGTHHGGPRDGGTHHGGTHHNDTRDGGTHHGDTRDSGTHHNDTHHNDTRDGGTHLGAVTRGRSGRAVTRADGGRYVCRATNRHGVAVRSVFVTVEYRPSIGDRGCPERRLWLEGTAAELRCAATGNPPPRVTCDKLGDSGDLPQATATATRSGLSDSRDPQATATATRAEPGHSRDPQATANATRAEPGDSRDLPQATANVTRDSRDPPQATANVTRDSRDLPQATANVTRAHAGTYQCRATNAHGSAIRNVTVAVEYGPGGVTVRVLPSANVTRGSAFTVDCGAEGVPAPTYTWALPPAPNLRLAADNRSVTVTAATAANRGVYTCTASNRHGRRAGSVVVRVDESWLPVLVALGALGAVTALGLALAGGYYLKTTACKKGEYNVRDAEGSSEAACLHRHRDPRAEVFGIQLTQP